MYNRKIAMAVAAAMTIAGSAHAPAAAAGVILPLQAPTARELCGADPLRSPATLIWGPSALGPVLITIPALFAAIALATVLILAARTRFAILAVGSVVPFLMGKQFVGF